MSWRCTLIISFFVLVLIGLFHFFLLEPIRQNCADKIEEFEIDISIKTEELDKFVSKDFMQIKTNGNFIDRGLKVKSKNGDILLLDSLITGDNCFLIFRFSDFNCIACYEDYFSQIRFFFDDIGNENILFLAKYSSMRDLNVFLRTQNFSCRTYNLFEEGLGLSIENLREPYFFILDSSFEIKNVFIVSKGYPELTDEYLNQVSKFL